MRVMSRTAVLAGLLAFAGCASMGGERPVGTTGTTEPPAPTQPTQVEGTEPGRIPVGQQLDVRLQSRLSSETAEPEQRFQATTVVDLMQGDRVLVPAGSTVRGFVSSVQPAGRVDRSGQLTLAFDQLVVNGREYEIRGLATQVFESRGIRDEVGTVGTAGAVGAIVGGILGGVRGALLGAAVGGGGVIAATEGEDVVLPAGTIVRIRMDTPVEVRQGG